MGYFTRHELEILGGHYDLLKEIIESDEEVFYGLDTDGTCLDEVKWYDHEADMRNVSKKYPDKIFKLSGEGEESGDIWIEYYKNGKMQRCEAKIVFDDFNENKLT